MENIILPKQFINQFLKYYCTEVVIWENQECTNLSQWVWLLLTLMIPPYIQSGYKLQMSVCPLNDKQNVYLCNNLLDVKLTAIDEISMVSRKLFG